MFDNIEVVLASGSPRRKQLLKDSEIDFLVLKPFVDEQSPMGLLPSNIPEYLAEKKATATQRLKNAERTLIIAADTIVLLEENILGKPGNAEEARRMLENLSGNTHTVVTGVCLLYEDKKSVFSVETRVVFSRLKEEWIRHYIKNYQPFDKAGSYGIQEWIGLIGIEKIDGDYSNVVGLPVSRTIREMEKIIGS